MCYNGFAEGICTSTTLSQSSDVFILPQKEDAVKRLFFVPFDNYLDISSITALAIALAICGNAAMKQP